MALFASPELLFRVAALVDLRAARRRHAAAGLVAEPARSGADARLAVLDHRHPVKIHRLQIIARGKVRIFKTSMSGREQVLAANGPGESIAELPVFDGGPYPASAIAIEETEIAFISRAAPPTQSRPSCTMSCC